MSDKAYLILADGSVFEGTARGAKGTSVGELIFDTGMSGYQEVLTDPTFAGQIVMMTYPLIGNCGVNDEDNEADVSYLKGLVVKELVDLPNNYRMQGTINDFLIQKNIIAIEGTDTREITRILRSKGVMNAVITTEELSFEDVKEKIASYKIEGMVEKTTSDKIYKQGDGKFSVALLDLGQKKSFINSLNKRGASVTVYPASTPAEVILNAGHDGVLISSGAGNPCDCEFQIKTVKQLLEAKIPMLGISMGHQLIALASGAKTYKLPYGHHGANHPVFDSAKNKTFITAQNHGYAVDGSTVNESIAEISHINKNDNTVEGLRFKNAPVISVQFSPEGSPGPRETKYIFDDFILMLGGKANA